MRKIDFGGSDWSAHRQDHWLELAGNPNFPDYLRIMFVAYGRHAANGHARLDRGELAAYLVRRDGTLADRRDIWKSLRRAVGLGYLLDGSSLLCLVVGAHDVQGGRGKPDARCKRDHTKRPKTNVGNSSRRSFTNVGTESGRSDTNVGDEYRRSEPEPSISSTDPATDLGAA